MAAFLVVFLAGLRLANSSAARFIACLVARPACLTRPPFFATFSAFLAVAKSFVVFANLATFETGTKFKAVQNAPFKRERFLPVAHLSP